MTEQEILERVQAIDLMLLKEFDRICSKYDIQYYLAFGSLLGAVRHQGIIPWDDDIDLWMDRKNYQKLCGHREDFGEDYEFLRPEDYGKKKKIAAVARLYYKYSFIDFSGRSGRNADARGNRLHLDVFLIDCTYNNLKGTLQKLELYLLYGLINAYRTEELELMASRPFYYRAAQACLDIVGKIIPLGWLWKRVAKVAARYDEKPDTDIFRVTTDALEGIERIFPKSALSETLFMDFEDMKAPVPSGYDEILKVIYGDYMTLPPAEEQTLHLGPVRWKDPGAVIDAKVDYDKVVFVKPKKENQGDCV